MKAIKYWCDLFENCAGMRFCKVFFAYLAHIIGFATANRPAGDFRYYVSPNICYICITCREFQATNQM